MNARPFPTKLAAIVAAMLVLTACNTAGSTPSAAPTATPSPSNISGDYTGSMTDSSSGAGSATATLAQSGSSAGGTITDTEAGQTLSAQLSLAIDSSNAVSGAMVIDFPPAGTGPTCTFGVTGSYDPNANVLSGSYSAITNCTGETGTFSLSQQCVDTARAVRRRMHVPIVC